MTGTAEMRPELDDASPAELSAGFSFCINVMQKRSEFLAAAKAKRVHMPAFVLQARKRAEGSNEVRIGFTCSKKVGNAVARNRAKRRLREVARLGLPFGAVPGWDYVLIGRFEKTATRDFALLQADLVDALRQIHP